MEGLHRITIIDTIPLTTVAPLTGDTLDTIIKAAGYEQGITAMVGIYVGGVAGNLVYEPLTSGVATRTLPVVANGTVALRAKRITTDSTATVMFILIGDM